MLSTTLALSGYAPQVYHDAFIGHYHGPPAPLAHDGQVVDTPEVVHAKKAHLIAHAAEAAKTAHYGGGFPQDGSYIGEFQGGFSGGSIGGGHKEIYTGYHGKYHGPPAPLGHDGQVVDTPEVVHAKAAHHAAHAKELSKVAHLSPYPYAQGGGLW